MTNNVKPVEVLDEDLEIDVRITAQETEDTFEAWKREEHYNENEYPEGVYLGDGVYL